MNLSKTLANFKLALQAKQRLQYQILWNIEFKLEGFSVVKSDDAVLVTCGAPADVAMAFVQGNSTSAVIYVNSGLLALPKENQMAWLYHEIGHVKKMHLDNQKKHALVKRLLGFKESIDIEIEADKYAADNGYAQAMYDNLISYVESMGSSREIRRRLHALQQLVK